MAANRPLEIVLRPGKRSDQKTGRRLNILDPGKSNAGKMREKAKIPACSTQYCAPYSGICTS
ncbi:hypothetical protein [uncultured Comamonas sp.]|uniref:hypothetical protein n=1 Tax=uncultured Comamonas sp. TaxID=114710 RepID=UPI0025E45380|nr:hypothetical protein [uncultured Comamonas sp.]